MILQVARPSFNILRFRGQSVLSQEEVPYKRNVVRKGLRKVIDNLIRISVNLVFHARKQILKLWDRNPWLGYCRKLYELCRAL